MSAKYTTKDGWLTADVIQAPDAAPQGVEVRINYGPLYQYALGRGLDYNELCSLVRAALASKAEPLTDEQIDAVSSQFALDGGKGPLLIIGRDNAKTFARAILDAARASTEGKP